MRSDLPSRIRLQRLHETWLIREVPIRNELDQDQTVDRPCESREARDPRSPKVLDFHFVRIDLFRLNDALGLISYSFYPRYLTSLIFRFERDLIARSVTSLFKTNKWNFFNLTSMQLFL